MMRLKRRIRAVGAMLVVLVLAVLHVAGPVAEANVPTVRMGTLQVEDYYDTLRDAFYLEDYYVAGACNGWVLNVINRSGLVPELVVDGTTVLELNDALKNSECFDLVASREGGFNDYQDATNEMQEDVNAGKIKAGDIVIYTKNMKDYETTGGPHWLHAAIVMKELFNGTVENYKNYWVHRWRESYWGFPTIAHALAPDFGVEYYSPLTSPSSTEADDSGSTGYYVYRINTEKAKEAFEKATATETESETEASTSEITASEKSGTATTEKTSTSQTDTEESISGNASTVTPNASGGGSGSGAFGRVLSMLVVLFSGILLFLCILIL